MMLELVDLVKKFGRTTALDGVNLCVAPRSIFGFVGPNGAGKTTAIKIITGLIAPTSGGVRLNGEGLTDRTCAEKIGYMPDFFGVYDNLKVNEYMDFYAGTYYIPYAKRRGIIHELLETVNLSDKYDAYVDSLSRGMKQRLCLARSLVHDPDILVLDEPASGLDPRSRVEMKAVLRRLSGTGKTVIVSSHILPELSEMCTDIGVISRGKIVAAGNVEDILRNLQSARILQMRPLGEPDALINFLRSLPEAGEPALASGGIEFSFAGDDTALAGLIAAVTAQGIGITAVSEKQGSLEDVYMQLTSFSGEGGHADEQQSEPGI
ncbi:MAG: ABC transporter ATP-binding protein [Defluviitaleaceae bacterium]|nr:ABC transporter ATP-binding protein [Defluviitaleaceae bacterium]